MAVPWYYRVRQITHQLETLVFRDLTVYPIVITEPVVNLAHIAQTRIEGFELGVMLEQTLNDFIMIAARGDGSSKTIDVFSVVYTGCFPPVFCGDRYEDIVPDALKSSARVFQTDRRVSDSFVGHHG